MKKKPQRDATKLPKFWFVLVKIWLSYALTIQQSNFYQIPAREELGVFPHDHVSLNK